MKKYLIIADDFTGSNDTGVQLANLGVDVNVQFSVASPHKGTIVLDTETRNSSTEEAADRLNSLLQKLDFKQYDEVIKKVDSTLRGNISIEMRLLASYYHPDIIAFAPALPDQNRVVVRSTLKVAGIRAMKTDFAKDPIKPIRNDDVQNLMEQAFPGEPLRHYSVSEIRDSEFHVENTRCVSFDSENNQDLIRIVHALRQTTKRILWVGSAGLTSALLMKDFSVAPALGLIGSVSEVTRKQLHAAEQNGIRLVNIPIYEAYKQQTYAPYVDAATTALLAGQDVILMSSASYDRSELDKTLTALAKYNLSDEEINSLTQAVLSGICRKVLAKVKVSGLFVSGGETAKGFLRIGKAAGAKVITELASGVPLLEVQQGDFSGMRVVTKAGAFGNQDLINFAFKKIKSMNQCV